MSGTSRAASSKAPDQSAIWWPGAGNAIKTVDFDDASAKARGASCGTSQHLIAMRDAGLLVGVRHEIRYARTRLGTELCQAGRR